jgi:hypothetical protein
MTAPEPWRDPPPPPPPRRHPEDPCTLARDKRNQVTEFGYGPGLVPRHLNGRPPSEGGIYMPKAPPVDESGRQLPRKPTEARGYPGDRVG